MSLASYSGACAALVQELVESLSSDEVQMLRTTLSQTPASEWVHWCHMNKGPIEAFVRATPTKRKRNRDWSDPEVRAYLTLAAIHLVQGAQALLSAIDRQDLSPGHSYREMASRAGAAHRDLLDYERQQWPFSGDDLFQD